MRKPNFFPVSSQVNTNFTSKEHIELKEMITNPLFNQLTELSSDTKALYKFDGKNIAHLNVIKDCTRIAQQKLEDSMAIDKKAALSFLFGVVAQATAFLPFSWIIAPLAFMYTGYLIKERIPAYDEYTQSIDNLVRCADWALNKTDTNSEDINLDDIKEMLKLLKQVMTKEQLKGVIVDGDLENEFLATALIEEKLLTTNYTPEEFGAALEFSDVEKQKTLAYTVYGYMQGGSLAAMATKIGSYLQVMLRQAAATSYQYLSEMSATTTAGM